MTKCTHEKMCPLRTKGIRDQNQSVFKGRNIVWYTNRLGTSVCVQTRMANLHSQGLFIHCAMYKI